MIRLSKLAQARLGYAVGCLLAALGAGIEFGLGYGLIVAGVAAVASFLFLADVEDDEDGEGRR